MLNSKNTSKNFADEMSIYNIMKFPQLMSSMNVTRKNCGLDFSLNSFLIVVGLGK